MVGRHLTYLTTTRFKLSPRTPLVNLIIVISGIGTVIYHHLGDRRDNTVPNIDTQQITQPCRSTRVPQPSAASLQSKEYQERKAISQDEGQDWATTRQYPHTFAVINWAPDEQGNYITCLAE